MPTDSDNDVNGAGHVDVGGEDEDDDDFFNQVYGQEYRGPESGGRWPKAEEQQCTPGSSSTRSKHQVRDSEEDQRRELEDAEWRERDPHALPTDFTTREARVWEARSKAAERNWKRRKEEELICSLCGEYGHFSQGCPSTLGGGPAAVSVGGSRYDHIRKVPVADRRLRARIIGTGGSVVQGIEKSCGCRVRLEDAPAGGLTAVISAPSEKKAKKGEHAILAIVKQAEEESGGWRGAVAMPGDGHIRESAHRIPSTSHAALTDPPAGRYSRQHDAAAASDSYGWQENSNSSGRFGVQHEQHQSAAASAVIEFGSQYRDGGYEGSHGGRGEDHMAQVRSRGLEELEQRFLEESMAITEAQSVAEKEEKERHAKAMHDIRQEFQSRLLAVRQRQSQDQQAYMDSFRFQSKPTSKFHGPGRVPAVLDGQQKKIVRQPYSFSRHSSPPTTKFSSRPGATPPYGRHVDTEMSLDGGRVGGDQEGLGGRFGNRRYRSDDYHSQVVGNPSAYRRQ